MTDPPPPGPPVAPRAPAPPPDGPTGWLRLTLQGSPLTGSLITPAVSVNGHRVVAHYGDNVIPVHAGPNRVEVACRWIFEFGRATLDTQVAPAGQVPVFYAVPWHQFSGGAIGHVPQRRPGVLGFAVMMTALVLIVVALLVLPTL